MKSIESITVRDLNFSYNSYHEIFEDADATFNKGRLYYLIGESGAGKTALAKLLMGEYEVADGTIFFDGKDINQCRVEQLQQLITWVPNETMIWNTDVKENILCGRQYEAEKYHQVCKDCEIEDVESVIDEITANLDRETELMIKNNIEKYVHDKIIILITHSKEFIRRDAVVYEVKDRAICRVGSEEVN